MSSIFGGLLGRMNCAGSIMPRLVQIGTRTLLVALLAFMVTSAAVPADAAIALRNVSSPASANSGSISVSRPSGTVQDDIMILAVTTYDNVMLSLPAGWTKFVEQNNGSNLRSTVAWKRAGSSEPSSYNVSHSGGSTIVAAIASFSGCVTSGSPVDVVSIRSNGSSSTVTANAISSTVADAMVVFSSHLDNDRSHSNWSATNPSTLTEAFDYDVNLSGDVTVALAYATRSTAGSTGTATASLSGSARSNGILFALKPAPAAAAGTIQLSAASYSVAEGGGSVTITAIRTGGSSGAVSVSYATSNGTATAGSDYSSASGTLSWANGDTANKSFNVTILNDTLVEGNETFTVALSNTTGGATLGSPASATVTITDDDAAPPTGGLLHNSITTGSSYWSSQGGWGVAGGKYGQFTCTTCHVEEAPNIKRIKGTITVPDTSKGNIPGSTVNFQTTTAPGSFGDDAIAHASSSKICEVCHTLTSVHKYNQPTVVLHETPIGIPDCVACHKHNQGFRPAGGCTICHSVALGNRAAITSQFSANSHHIQQNGQPVADIQCAQCHWEANSDGSINALYHGGSANPGSPVNLVIYGAGIRPATYAEGSTAISYTANGSRTEMAKINSHCLGCHSSQNNTTQPFGDGKTPKQYAWDSTSVAERYSQSGTTPWGKYSGANVTPKNTQTKAYSAHGNAAANQRGWNLNETWPNTSGMVQVLCFDCHNSHGSSASGKTSSYASATPSGGILKDTIAGKSGYTVTYKPVAGGSAADRNAHNPGAALCFDCHMTQNAGSKPWGYQGTFGASQAILGYWEKPYWFGAAGINPSGAQMRYAYKNKIGSQGGHFGASSSLASSAMGTIGGLCTPCHDPHGVSPTLGANQQYAVPLLKGTWMTSPYKEDAAPLATNEKRGGGEEQAPFAGASTPGYTIDQNTFNTLPTTSPFTWNFSSTAKVSQTDSQFGGLCMQCHAKAALNPSSTAGWKSVSRIHSTVKGWGNNTMHNFTCAKCHTPHNSCLPRLMISNCLDYGHRGRVGQGGVVRTGTNAYTGRLAGEEGRGNGKFPSGGGGWGEKPMGWSRNNSGGAYFFGIAGTSKNTYPPLRACHDNIGAGTWPDVEYWNVKTPWTAP